MRDYRHDMVDLSRFRRVPSTSARDDRILDGLEEHEIPQVTAALAALRDLADASATPNGALRDVFANGLGVEAVGAPTVLPKQRARFRVLTAKLAGFGLLAQVGLGVAAASAITVGAATTDSLPGPAQDLVAGWVERVTPFDVPDSADFGHDVADDARDDTPGVDGRDVADEVALDDRPPADTPPVDVPAEPGRPDEPPGFDVAEGAPAPTDHQPPYQYWRQRPSQTPTSDAGNGNASERGSEVSEAPSSPPTPDPSRRPSERPSRG